MRIILAFLAIAALSSAEKPPITSESTMSSMGRLAKHRAEEVNTPSGPAITGLRALPGRCVNEPDCAEAALISSSLQSETSIAVDSTGQHIVVGFNDFRGFAFPALSVSGFMYSDDGGGTFVDGGRLPAGPTTVIAGQLFPQIFGDPDVKYLGACNFVYSSILLKAVSAAGVAQTLSIHRSTDCGHTWSGPFEVPAATNPNGKFDTNGDVQDAADKELGDVDPDTKRYMLCWSNFTPVAAEMSCSYSDNVLASVPVFSPRTVVAASPADGQGMSVRFAGNGSPNVYVAWGRFPGTLSGYANNIGFARSIDNGATWGAPVNLTSDFLTMDQVLGNDRVNNFPSLAVDASPGSFSGSVYAVYSNNNSRDGADVAFQRSTNGGVTFSAPIFLNAKPGADRAQWFPYVTVDRSTGRVWVFYYDQGAATSGDLTQVTYLYSDTGGATWSTPSALTQRPFKAGWGNDGSQPNLGDYNQAVAQDGTLYAVYAETRQVGFTDGQPSTSMSPPDINVTKVGPGASQPPPLRAGAITFTESGGDGNIDPGDRVQFKIPLENYVANPLNAAAVSSVSAILSTTAPGVSLVQPGSSYPNIAVGANAINLSGYIVQISPAFAAGTPIEFSLAITTAQGSATVLFTQQTGTAVYTTLLNENFDGSAPGSLPAGWTSAHGGGVNTVPWTTSSSFATTLCGTSNKAFHQNANDGLPGGSPARWERLFSPLVNIPSNAQYVTVEFDVCYDTENDTVLPLTGYDGFFLRITDQTPGRTLRSVLAEAFEQEFTTDGFQHYPKHFPRNSDPSYFEDMSAWSGFSNGPQHVRMRFPGMEGSRVQLRFEFAQDSFGTCADVRPGHTCGVTIDNVTIRSVIPVAPLSVNLQITPSLARDPVTSEVVATLSVTDTGTGTASNVQFSSALLNGTPAATALPNLGSIAPGGSATTAVRFPGSGFAAGSPAVLRVAGSYTGGSFQVSLRVAIP